MWEKISNILKWVIGIRIEGQNINIVRKNFTTQILKIQMYSLLADIVYVEATRVKKHRYKKEFISAKLFQHSKARPMITRSTFFNLANETNANKLFPTTCRSY